MFVAYLSFTAILVVTPGSTTAVVVKNTLEGGRRAGLASALGAAAANSTHALLAGLGLSVLLAHWPSAIGAVRLVGAAYLAWLGLVSVWRAWAFLDGGLRFTLADGYAPEPGHERQSFRDGLAINLLNPAIISFYLAIVPTFIPPDAPRFYYTALAATHVSLALACHSMWATALDALRRWFAPPLARRALQALTGAALVLLALRVVL